MRTLTGCVSAAILTAIGGAHMADASEQLVIDTCSACHSPTDNGLSRIDGQRKTPEGWKRDQLIGAQSADRVEAFLEKGIELSHVESSETTTK